jgi:hypothetical protein
MTDCWYCGEPGCKCGVERFDRMRSALQVISEYAVDEHADMPRDVMGHIRTLAFRALEPIHDNEPKGTP